MLQQFHNHFVKSFHQPNYCYIVAVSGGVDSVVACYLFKAANLPFAIAHCNFNLRGEESKRDEVFVQKLATQLFVPFYVNHFSTEKHATEKKISIQVAARELRYNWFAQLQNELEKQNENCYLVTAHHANDAIETSLHQYFRGTGIEGLTGINFLDKERKVVRPLLSFTKTQILEYVKEKNIQYVEDSSNNSNKYKRNFIRNKLLPILQEEYPSIEQNLMNNLQRMQEVEEVYAQSILSVKNNLVKKEGDLLKVATLQLLKQKPLKTIVWEIFKDYNFTSAQIPEIVKLCTANNSAFVKSETHRVIKNRNWLFITALEQKQNSFFVIEEEGTYSINNQKITCKLTHDFSLDAAKKLAPNQAWLDANSIKFPLIIRSPKTGDYFYPLGMNKKKKLSRFFIDQKLSAQQKEEVLLVESNKKIVWIVGYRINERCKITTQTKQIWQLRFM